MAYCTEWIMIGGVGQSMVDTAEVRLSIQRAGQGTPLVLLHGHPQNHHCWEKVAPALARHFDVIIPNVRGCGDSDAPADAA
jgi:haloacetate dehalogenase